MYRFANVFVNCIMTYLSTVMYLNSIKYNDSFKLSVPCHPFLCSFPPLPPPSPYRSLVRMRRRLGITCHTKINWTIVVADINKNAPNYISHSVSSPPQYLVLFKEALTINGLRASFYVHIRQLSSFKAPTLWFIDLTVATYHMRLQCTFLSLWFFFTRKRTKHENS